MIVVKGGSREASPAFTQGNFLLLLLLRPPPPTFRPISQPWGPYPSGVSQNNFISSPWAGRGFFTWGMVYTSGETSLVATPGPPWVRPPLHSCPKWPKKCQNWYGSLKTTGNTVPTGTKENNIFSLLKMTNLIWKQILVDLLNRFYIIKKNHNWIVHWKHMKRWKKSQNLTNFL